MNVYKLFIIENLDNGVELKCIKNNGKILKKPWKYIKLNIRDIWQKN